MEALAHIFNSLNLTVREDDLSLDCRTLVVRGGDDTLQTLADMLLVAASKGEAPIEKRHLPEWLRRLDWAIRDGRLYGPKEITAGVKNADGLASVTSHYVKIVELVSEGDEPKQYLARLEPKAELSERMTSLGLLQTVWLKNSPVLRILRLNFWVGNYETAKHISRELSIGLREQLLVVKGESPSLASNSMSITLHVINGITAAVVCINNPKEVKSVTYLDEARALLAHLPGCWLSAGDLVGRIPNVLPHQRLLTQADQIKDRGPNQLIRDLTGFDQTPLLYGATDIGGNWVELLQLWVACFRTGLPGVFDIDVRAHDLGSYWDRILSPSVALIGGSAELPVSTRGLSGGDITMAQLTRLVDLPQVDGVVRLLHLTVPEFYIELHRQFVEVLNKLFGASVQIAVVEGETLFKPVAEVITVGQAVDAISETLKENRVIANWPDGRQIRLCDIRDERTLTISEWMSWNVWPGGALTYLLMGGLAHYGPITFNLKDSRLGNVSLVSAVDLNLGTGTNEAQYAVSGVTRCYPKYSSREGGDNVDLLILFEMLERYPDRVTALLHEMVRRWIFPMTPAQVGLNQVFEVRYHGGWSYNRHWEGQNGNIPA